MSDIARFSLGLLPFILFLGSLAYFIHSGGFKRTWLNFCWLFFIVVIGLGIYAMEMEHRANEVEIQSLKDKVHSLSGFGCGETDWPCVRMRVHVDCVDELVECGDLLKEKEDQGRD